MADDLVAATEKLGPVSAVPPGMVQVFGLNMPPAMYTRILAAVRGVYPGETNSKTDAGAAQAALKRIIIDLVTQWEVSNSSPPLPDVIRQATDNVTAQQRAAAQTAQSDGDSQIQPTVTA